MESEHDKIVPHPVLGNYRNACIDALSVTYRKILHADHALSDERSRSSYISILVHWLEEMMLGARGHLRSKTSMLPDSAGPIHSSSRPKPGA